ncbi:MAG: Glu/Leu/Phe/Val dehydrogenase [Candidatus Nitronauta litoralis]|uniref:Glutamate dehydrogenase n=1 Tax=Candidatus Nitronauta litoralis TaxID=2705533 RepID=A0A7T0BYS3_9BACT|nr:MAG: Glu/Leu/Phe/Val dehydrogenase [Candidatus Nitronauta litoralis]
MSNSESIPQLPKRLELEELPQISGGRFSVHDQAEEQSRYRMVDPATGEAKGFVVVDNTNRGPGLGGIRIAPDLTLSEVGRLAYAMSLKNSVACLPYGGGKAGLVGNPDLLIANPDFKKELIHLTAETLFTLPSYIPAPDMGTNDHDVQQIYDYYSEKLGTKFHKRGGASRLPETGGIPIDAWALTAHGMVSALETLESLQGDFSIKGCRVVVQGFGNVGAPAVEKLAALGARIVGASDINRAIFHSKGLNISSLMDAKKKGGLIHYSDETEKSFDSKHVDWLLEAPCDVLIPAARPDAITARNADRIDCKIVIQGANAPSNRLTEYYLENRRGILNCSDFIVNVGGVIGCAAELEMTMDEDYRARVLASGNNGRSYVENLIYNTVARNTKEIMGRLNSSPIKDKTFREEALALAEDRLGQPELTWL